MRVKQSVLVLDHEPDSLAALSGLFTFAGFKTISCASVSQILRRQPKHQADCIIANAGIPLLPDTQLIPLLQSAQPDVPVILITNNQDIAAAVDAIRAGAKHLLEKPVVDRILLEHVEALIADRQEPYQRPN